MSKQDTNEAFAITSGIEGTFYIFLEMKTCIISKFLTHLFWTFFYPDIQSLQMVTAAVKLKDAYLLEQKLWPT